MSLAGLFTTPIPALGLAVCRAMLGGVLLADAIARIRDRAIWYGPNALRPRREGDGGANLLLAVHALSCGAFAIGLSTRLAGLFVLVTLVLLHRRNPFIRYGGDALALTLVALLLASPCDRALSVDAWREGGGLALDAIAAPWGGRLLQIEVAALYAANGLAKLGNPAWRDGSALRIVLANRNLVRAWVPAGIGRWSTPLTWGTLAAELALGPALFVAPLLASIAGVLFHVALAVFIDVHLFSALMIAALTSVAFAPSAASILASTAPAVTAWQWGVLVAVGTYLILVFVIWDLAEMARVRAALSRMGISRDWRRLFAEPLSADEVRVEVVVVGGDGSTQRYEWDPRVPLFDAPRKLAHRVERLKGMLWTSREARDVVGRHLRGAVARSASVIRAAAGAVVLVPAGDPTEPVPALPLFVSVRRKNGVVDQAALTALGQATRSRLRDVDAFTGPKEQRP